MAGEISFQPAEMDYLLAARAFYRQQVRSRRFLGRLAMLAGFVSVLVVGGVLLLGAGVHEALMSGIAGALSGLVALIPCLGLNYLLMPRRVGRLFRQSRTQHHVTTFGWSDEGAWWKSPESQQKSPWSRYHRWHETRSVYLLYLNDQLYQFVPRHVLTAEQALDLTDTIKASELPER
jgi:hypothetical protein